MKNSIELINVNKIYNIYNSKKDRFKEAISFKKNKYSNEFYALKNINLKVEKGETLGIIGLNGAGKSTLLKIISEVLNPTSGDVLINGRITSLLELGAGFDVEYTGLENIFLYGSIYGYDKQQIEAKLDEIINFADIGEFIEQPVKLYSSGMFARLAFAVIAHLDPEILIVDEALSVGDVFFQHKCNVFMKEKMAGITKILVTHDMNAISTLCDRVILLRHGQIIFDGDVKQGIEYYLKDSQNKLFENDELIQDVTYDQIDENIALNLTAIDENNISGSKKCVITSSLVTINNAGVNSEIVYAHDLVDVTFNVKAYDDVNNMIIGYLIKDQYGNAIFGNNTHDQKEFISLKKNESCIFSLQFKFPEIAPNDYYLTVGIGIGESESVHEIACWAHSIHHFKNINNRFVHALFNNDILVRKKEII